MCIGYKETRTGRDLILADSGDSAGAVAAISMSKGKSGVCDLCPVSEANQRVISGIWGSMVIARFQGCFVLINSVIWSGYVICFRDIYSGSLSPLEIL